MARSGLRYNGRMTPPGSLPPFPRSESPAPEMVADDGGGGSLSPDSAEPTAAKAVVPHRHNLLGTVIFQVILRCGAVFKTESIVMPAVLFSMGAQGWLRGFLPTIS